MVRYSIQKRIVNSRLLDLVLLTAVSLVILGSVVKNVSADVPSILQIDNLSQGSTGKIKVQIRHLNPSGGHYVDVVEADVAGQVKSFNLQAQSSNPFTVELELGQLQGTPDAKARAHCNLHGWSSWSDAIQVPELSNTAATVIAALAAALLITRRHTSYTREHSQSLAAM